MNDRPSPYPIRPSAELRAKLEAAARLGGRTLHAEIIARLEQSFEVDRTGVADLRIVDTAVLIEELVKRFPPGMFEMQIGDKRRSGTASTKEAVEAAE
ncbi:Arc family DNA-binding protein [Massilia sp. YIM B02769]|uniref:Arc family DNA-binding protein n=1 Tax=Massilia sp. YIM B02769 TaxID=3050129 RepID=UPI0025B62F9E|nr:Arc family DNA-binding protein [Massilia sp. YIM B02769]